MIKQGLEACLQSQSSTQKISCRNGILPTHPHQFYQLHSFDSLIWAHLCHDLDKHSNSLRPVVDWDFFQKTKILFTYTTAQCVSCVLCPEAIRFMTLMRALPWPSKREIFSQRAMVDQARGGLCYQRKT